MSLYGYKISNFARSEKYFEAENLLDKKLKGFEKDTTVFERDGSRSQRYFKKNEDGTEIEVILSKNVTESGIMVFSDIPLNYFKRGGWIFYLRDIVPMLIMAAIYWGCYYFILRQKWSAGGDTRMLQIAFVCSMIFTIISQIAVKVFGKNRSPLRVSFIALGSVFTVYTLLNRLSKLWYKWTFSVIWSNLLRTPVPPLLIAAFIMIVIHKLSSKESK